MQELTKTYGVAGVYIDQLAAAAPAPDWTRAHNHTLGGGYYWTEGIDAMLARTRSLIGYKSVLLTESNAEPYMDNIAVYLTLVAFASPFAGAGPRMAAAFPTVYGGYYVGAGSIYNRDDFLNTDVLCARMALSLVYGIQIGWFSLGGVTHGPDYDYGCGPMGTYEQWIDPKYANEVAYLQNLARMRGVLSSYVTHGRLARPPTLSPEPPFFSADASSQIYNKGPFPVLAAAAWRSDASNTVVFIFAGPTRNAFNTTIDVDMKDYEFIDARTQSFNLQQVHENGQRTNISTFHGGRLTYPMTVDSRSVLVYEVGLL